jgi:hypothetical protein
MKIVSIVYLLLGLLILGCVQPETQSALPKISFTEKDVNLVIAKRVVKDSGPSGINDRQIFDGKIFAFATFHWDDLATPAGDQEIEFHWFSGDRQVSTYKKTHKFGVAPYYVWASTYVTNIGIGKGRVELYCQGKRVATKDFELTEPKWNSPLSRP